ncbi:MAG: SH3 domain-containing protein [Acidovorax sp.]|nr:SH3 domain-containing protein [Acidovorax sp.]
MQAAIQPSKAFTDQLEALRSEGIRAALDEYSFVNMHLSAARAVEHPALAQIRRHVEASTAAAWFSTLDYTALAKTKAIEELLSPSKLAAKYFEKLTEGSTMKLAAEQAAKWSEPYKQLTGAFERFSEPLGASSVRALLESMAKANESFGVTRLLDDAVQLQESEDAHGEVAQMVQEVTLGISKALTAQEAVEQIVQAIHDTKEPKHQRLLFAILVPVLIAIVFAFVNPVADFYVKKWLDGTPKQEATKQVKEAAREAIRDFRMLNDYRFVSSQSLAVKSEPKTRAPVIGQLRFGQTVHILEKGRDFTLVVWRSENDQAELRGWVFSRYLKRFN